MIEMARPGSARGQAFASMALALLWVSGCRQVLSLDDLPSQPRIEVAFQTTDEIHDHTTQPLAIAVVLSAAATGTVSVGYSIDPISTAQPDADFTPMPPASCRSTRAKPRGRSR